MTQITVVFGSKNDPNIVFFLENIIFSQKIAIITLAPACPILRLLNLQLQRQSCSRLARF
jgi:hypothetical protein